MSTQVTINDVIPKTQITAAANQFVFTTNWTANAASDVVVYARTSSQQPDDLTQEVNSANYTVAFVGAQEIVEVTFIVPRNAGDVITITRNTPADRLNLYTNTNFTPSMLNQDVGILTLVDQQAQLYNWQVAPHYNVSSTPNLGDSFTGLGGDIYLPILGANQFWVKNAQDSAIIATDLPTGGGQLPVTLPIVTYTSTPYLTADANLGALSSGILEQFVAGGVATFNTKNTTGTGNVVLDNDPTITNPIINQIDDVNSTPILSFTGNMNAVNYINLQNSITGANPKFFATGTDANIAINLIPKGSEAVNIVSENATTPIRLYNGTNNQHQTQFNFSNTLASRNVTFQDADGTVAYLSDINTKAWVNFDGTTSPPTIKSSYNVTSITKSGTGQYTINFTTPFANTNYAVVLGYGTSANASYQVAHTIQYQSKLVGSVDLYSAAGNNGVYNFSVVDCSEISVVIYSN